MSTWLYQMNQRWWTPERYRLEIWEGQRWKWPVGRKTGKKTPERGDTVAFFYAMTGGEDPGFYGWAIVLEVLEEGKDTSLYFLPVAPSDYLKVCPWWDDTASRLADAIRGRVKQGTLWPVETALRDRLRVGIRRWVGGHSLTGEALGR